MHFISLFFWSKYPTGMLLSFYKGMWKIHFGEMYKTHKAVVSGVVISILCVCSMLVIQDMHVIPLSPWSAI